MIVLNNEGKVRLLEHKRAYLNTLRLRLFTNDITPDGDTESTDFVEPTFPGYADQSLNDFGPAILNGLDQGETIAPLHTFTVSSGTTPTSIYGYFTTDTDGQCVYSERNPAAPVTLAGAGSKYEVRPRFVEESF